MEPTSLKILTVNIRGFKTNIEKLTHSFAFKHCFYVVVNVETFLRRRLQQDTGLLALD